MAKIDAKTITEELQPLGWGLSDNIPYKRLDDQLEFICPNNHSVYLSWKIMRDRIKKGTCKCPICEEDEKMLAQQQAKEALGATSIPKKTGKRVLGLDQATHTTGYCIIEGGNIIKMGTFEAGNSKNEIERDLQVKYWMLSLVINWKIDYVCMEGIQLQDADKGFSNVELFATLARLQGILMATLLKHKIPYETVPVATWRNFNGVKGKSRTDRKMAMQQILKNETGLDLTNDTCDAVGIARYAYAQFMGANKMVEW